MKRHSRSIHGVADGLRAETAPPNRASRFAGCRGHEREALSVSCVPGLDAKMVGLQPEDRVEWRLRPASEPSEGAPQTVTKVWICLTSAAVAGMTDDWRIEPSAMHRSAPIAVIAAMNGNNRFSEDWEPCREALVAHVKEARVNISRLG